MLELETKYFEANKEELRKKYLGKHIVISGAAVVGVYASDNDAYLESIKTIEPGKFMIKLVTKTDAESVQRFMSLVYV